MHNWLSALLFFLPAGVANASPVIANKIPLLNRWNTPVDFGLTWRGKRLLGKNKTWRGILTGTLLAGLTGLLLSPLLSTGETRTEIVLFSMLMGFGALFGDAVESCLKRQRGIGSGQSWFPFDQIDYIIGGLLFVAPFAELTVAMLGLIFITYFGLHLLVAYIAYLLGLKDTPI